jgi:hypothetical protein
MDGEEARQAGSTVHGQPRAVNWVCVKCWCSCGSCAEADGMTHGPFERPWRRAVVLWYHKHALTLQYCTLTSPRRSSAISHTLPWRRGGVYLVPQARTYLTVLYPHQPSAVPYPGACPSNALPVSAIGNASTPTQILLYF